MNNCQKETSIYEWIQKDPQKLLTNNMSEKKEKKRVITLYTWLTWKYLQKMKKNGRHWYKEYNQETEVEFGIEKMCHVHDEKWEKINEMNKTT